MDIETVDLELKTDYKPFNSKYYLVPRINKENFHKDLKHLVKIGLLTLTQQSWYGTPVFIIPMKEGTVRFITGNHRFNQKLVGKMYSVPITGNTIQHLEGFQYATTLDLNMGYYNIKLSPNIYDMTTIVAEFWKFRYKRLLWECALWEIYPN